MRISTEGFLQELVRFSIRPFCIPCCNVIISCNAFGPPGHLILAGSGYVNTNLCKLGLNCKSHVLCKRKISPIGVIQGKLLSIFFTDTSAFIHHPSSFIQKCICFIQIIAPCAVISNVCVGRSGCKQAGGRSFVSIGQALGDFFLIDSVCNRLANLKIAQNFAGRIQNQVPGQGISIIDCALDPIQRKSLIIVIIAEKVSTVNQVNLTSL